MYSFQIKESMSMETRKKTYKNSALDNDALRKRREELTLTLRKQKREEQV